MTTDNEPDALGAFVAYVDRIADYLGRVMHDSSEDITLAPIAPSSPSERRILLEYLIGQTAHDVELAEQAVAWRTRPLWRRMLGIRPAWKRADVLPHLRDFSCPEERDAHAMVAAVIRRDHDLALALASPYSSDECDEEHVAMFAFQLFRLAVGTHRANHRTGVLA